MCLLWRSSTNLHPVIGQNMYRWKDGRFEQIGMGWLKHGFFALSLSDCGPCQATSGDTLGIDCSDPHTASSQGGLGPKYQVTPPLASSPTRQSVLLDQPHVAAGSIIGCDPRRIAVYSGRSMPKPRRLSGRHRRCVKQLLPPSVEYGFLEPSPVDGPTIQELPPLHHGTTWTPKWICMKLRFAKAPSGLDLACLTKVTALSVRYAIFNLNVDRSIGASVCRGRFNVDNVAIHKAPGGIREMFTNESWDMTISGGEMVWVLIHISPTG